MEEKIRTHEEVSQSVAAFMRTLGPIISGDRASLGVATIAAVVYAVVTYAREVGDPLHPMEARLTWEWLSALWTTPEDALQGARERLGRIGSNAAIEALACVAPGTAWSTLAGHERDRRRGLIHDWRVEGAVIRIERKKEGEQQP